MAQSGAPIERVVSVTNVDGMRRRFRVSDLPLAEGIGPEMVPQGALEVSVVDGTNIDELKARMTALATDEGALLANQEKAKQAEEEAQALLAQAELAAAAPDTAFSSYKP